MYSEAKKLHLIEELLKVESDTILDELEIVLTRSKTLLPGSKGLDGFKSNLSLEEVDELEKNINEGCENIDQDGWN